MNLIRIDLKTGKLKKIGTWIGITLHTARSFLKQAAQKEADSRKDIGHVALSDRHNGEATLVGHRGESLVFLYQEWPFDAKPSL